jgi:tetratricopeptide (TPR) repeat protein
VIEAALVWLSAFALYLRTLCPAMSSGDTAELFLAGRDLDITHPPGYPLLAMLIRLAFPVPAGGLMFRAGLVPAAAGAFAVMGVYRLAARLGASRGAALVSAALFAGLPLVWWQSTMLEKYAPQMALVPPVLIACLAPRPVLARAGYLAALALAHHSIAVFLAPAWLAAWWRSPGRRRLRPRAMALLLVFLPLSARPLCTAIRSAALHRLEASGVPSINWCEPYTARACLDYLRVKYYAARFGDVDLNRAGWRDHLGYYPAEFGWPLLLAGLAGLAVLVRRSRLAGGVLLAVLGVSAAFNARFVLPPSLAGVYHQTALLLLAASIAPALDALRERLPRAVGWAVLPTAAALIAGRAAARFPVADASRHLAVYDYNRAQLAALPARSVFLASFDYDMFAGRWFQGVLGFREDVTPVQVPFRVSPGQFVVRRRYRPWAAALLPGARLEFTDDDDHARILRRLLADNAGDRCFALSGLSEPARLPDLLDDCANVFLARSGSCGPVTPRRAWGVLRAGSSRTWFRPPATIPAHAIVHEMWAQALWSVSARVAGSPWHHRRMPLLRLRARMIPLQASAWLALAAANEQEGRFAEAAESAERARALDPDQPDGYLALLRLQDRLGALDAAARTLRLGLARPALAALPGAAAVRAALDARDGRGALEASRRWLAEAALASARRLRGNAEFDPRKVFLFRLAADLAPGWIEAQAAAVAAFQGRGRHDEAVPYLARLRRLDPARRDPAIAQAAALLAERRYAEARAALAALAREAPDLAAAWFYLGQADLALGRRADADAAFRRFLALVPDSPQAPVVREAIAALGRAPPR